MCPRVVTCCRSRQTLPDRQKRADSSARGGDLAEGVELEAKSSVGWTGPAKVRDQLGPRERLLSMEASWEGDGFFPVTRTGVRPFLTERVRVESSGMSAEPGK